MDRGAVFLKELKADGWTYGVQWNTFTDTGNTGPFISYFYDEGKGHGFSCTYDPSASKRRFPEDEYFFSHPGKVGPWLDELQPKVLSVCSELLAAARS